MKTQSVTIHRAVITWSNFDTPEVEQAVVFKIGGVIECAMSVEGMEISVNNIDIDIKTEPIVTFKTSDSESLIHELFIAHDKINWLWEL